MKTTRKHARTPLGECIADEARRRGLGISGLAKAAGVDGCNLHRSMTVGHRPTLATVQALATVLGSQSRVLELWAQLEVAGGG